MLRPTGVFLNRSAVMVPPEVVDVVSMPPAVSVTVMV